MSQNWLCMLHSISQTFQASGICIANFLSAILDRQSKQLVLNDSWAVCGREEICVRVVITLKCGQRHVQTAGSCWEIEVCCFTVRRTTSKRKKNREWWQSTKLLPDMKLCCGCGEVYVRAIDCLFRKVWFRINTNLKPIEKYMGLISTR